MTDTEIAVLAALKRGETVEYVVGFSGLTRQHVLDVGWKIGHLRFDAARDVMFDGLAERATPRPAPKRRDLVAEGRASERASVRTLAERAARTVANAKALLARLEIALDNPPKRGRPSKIAECGTPSGYRRHRYLREPACDACRAAANAYQREYKRRRTPSSESGRIRAWAVGRGLPVGLKGKIPAFIRDAYDAAHTDNADQGDTA